MHTNQRLLDQVDQQLHVADRSVAEKRAQWDRSVRLLNEVKSGLCALLRSLETVQVPLPLPYASAPWAHIQPRNR